MCHNFVHLRISRYTGDNSVMTVEKITTLLKRVPKKANQITSYVLVVLLWGPHAAQECVSLCDGPFFISPMFSAFIMPNWLLDMSLKGWLLQLLFAIPLLAIFFGLKRLEETKWGTIIKIDVIRWTVMWYSILLYYNLVFWSQSGREALLPLFMFIHS